MDGSPGSWDGWLEGAEAREHQLEADANVVGHQRQVGPLVLADLVVEPLDDELAGRGRLRRRSGRSSPERRGRARPFSSSLPAAWKRPPPSALIALDWNTARGNFALLNQGARGSSASLSAKPTVALPVSTVIATVPLCGAFGSSASWASNLRKRPSIGTPLCLTWNVISLCAGTSLAVGARLRAGRRREQERREASCASRAQPGVHARLRLGHHGHMRTSRPSRVEKWCLSAAAT